MSVPTFDTAPSVSQPKRFVSIDALRGFDMLCILGADSLAKSMQGLTDQPWAKVLHEQLEHVPWDGFHFYDLIFPLFVFLMGVSTVFSLDKILDQDGEVGAYKRIFRRGLILYLLGIFYHGGIGDPEQFRYLGVLHRIAICYVAGAVLYVNLRFRGLLVALVILLGGYWALMTFVPVPGHGPGTYEEGTNLANYIDTHYLPGYKWDGDWDPEGLLSTLPAIGSGILGIFAGLLLSNQHMGAARRVAALLLLGGICIAAGYGWHVAPSLECPVIKKLWTPSFVLYAAGWSFVMVAVCHLVIDVIGFQIWSRPFVWIGMNPITLYMLNNMVGGYEKLVQRVVLDRWQASAGPELGPLIMGLCTVSIPIALAWVLYRNKAFIRI